MNESTYNTASGQSYNFQTSDFRSQILISLWWWHGCARHLGVSQASGSSTAITCFGKWVLSGEDQNQYLDLSRVILVWAGGRAGFYQPKCAPEGCYKWVRAITTQPKQRLRQRCQRKSRQEPNTPTQMSNTRERWLWQLIVRNTATRLMWGQVLQKSVNRFWLKCEISIGMESPSLLQHANVGRPILDEQFIFECWIMCKVMYVCGMGKGANSDSSSRCANQDSRNSCFRVSAIPTTRGGGWRYSHHQPGSPWPGDWCTVTCSLTFI